MADKPSPDAARVWRERAAIGDFGSRLRHAKAPWVCEFAEGATQIGVGKFTPGDRIAVTSIARRKGATDAEMRPLLADVVAIVHPDLKVVTAGICE